MPDDPKCDRCTARLDAMEAMLAKLHDQIVDFRQGIEGRNLVGEAMGAWESGWKAKHGAAYTWNRKADPAQIKRFLRQMDLAELVRRMTKYLASTDPFHVKNQHPFNLFITQINTFAGNGNGHVEMGGEALRPHDCRHAPPCSTDQEHTCRRAAEARR